VARRTVVRLQLSGGVEARGLVEAAERAGAERTQCNGTGVSFIAPPEHRLEVIRAIEHIGGIVEEFHTEDPDWEALIRDHFDSRMEER
jgi:shikimate kinase